MLRAVSAGSHDSTSARVAAPGSRSGVPSSTPTRSIQKGVRRPSSGSPSSAARTSALPLLAETTRLLRPAAAFARRTSATTAAFASTLSRSPVGARGTGAPSQRSSAERSAPVSGFDS